MPSIRRVALLGSLLVIFAWSVALVGSGRPVDAHPLGNFTINHYDRIEVSETGIDVYSVLDMAEIPTFQELQSLGATDNSSIDDGAVTAYAATKADDIRRNLHLRLNGAAASLTEVRHSITFPPGQGGLLSLRLTADYRAELPVDWRTSPARVEFEDTNDADRLGWREVIVRSIGAVQLVDPSVPAVDESAELTAYPPDSLTRPKDVRSATFTFRPGFGVAPVPTPDRTTRATRGNPDSTLTRFAGLIATDRLTPGVVALALLAALGFGALHALSPGHGKTVVGAYLVGSRGTASHAVLLGLVVTATHTSTVYLVGFVTLYLSEYIVPERLYPWLGVASGGLIMLMGLWLFAGRLRSSGLVDQGVAWLMAKLRSAKRVPLVLGHGEAGGFALPSLHEHSVGASSHVHHEGEHPHEHDVIPGSSHQHPKEHPHGWGSGHAHVAPGERLNLRQLIGLGIFGGILPCPSAIVVMLSAVALHRVGFGLVLIVAFSLGLAGVLTSIGLAMVYAPAISRRLPFVARFVDRANESGRLSTAAVRFFPVVTAAAVSVAGVVILTRAVGQF